MDENALLRNFILKNTTLCGGPSEIKRPSLTVEDLKDQGTTENSICRLFNGPTSNQLLLKKNQTPHQNLYDLKVEYP